VFYLLWLISLYALAITVACVQLLIRIRLYKAGAKFAPPPQKTAPVEMPVIYILHEGQTLTWFQMWREIPPALRNACNRHVPIKVVPQRRGVKIQWEQTEEGGEENHV
jgi:hypothetical protein